LKVKSLASSIFLIKNVLQQSIASNNNFYNNISLPKLYEGKNIEELAARGLQLDACCLGLEACRLHLEQLGA
jgi:hypothetical protein